MAQDHIFGWVDDPTEVEMVVSQMERPLFGLAARPLQDSGRGQVRLLYEFVREVFGRDLVHAQTIGDCVSHGFGLGVDILAAVEEKLHGEHESQPAETATEPIYGYSRVEIGRGRLGRGDGSIGAWAAKSVRLGGTLLRKPYKIGNIVHDFSKYSGAKARDMGEPRAGVPDDLESTMREHLVRQTSMVTSYEEARDSIYNGYPIPVCSNQGFTNVRDKDGFLRPSGKWSHCMLFCGCDDESRRPGLLIANSWGLHWVRGSKGRFDIPDGYFWCDAEVADRMLRQQDSYALSSYDGYVKRDETLDILLGGMGWPSEAPVTAV